MRESLLPQLAGDLAAHLSTKERVFYPAARAALDDHAWLDRSEHWHGQARQALDRAMDAPIEGEEFATALGELHAALGAHADEEERLLFPRLEQALDPRALRQLALSMMALYDAKQETGFAVEDRYSPMPMRAAPAVRAGA